MLPDDDHLPAKLLELSAVSFVPFLGLLKFRFPELLIGFRNPLIACWIAMPKASVDEYGNFSFRDKRYPVDPAFSSNRAYNRGILFS